MSPRSGDLLDVGRQIHLVRNAAPHEVQLLTVERVQKDLVWVVGAELRGRPGEPVTLECWLPDDAVYRAEGRIEAACSLRRTGAWRRVQRREHVRVAVRGVQVALADDPDGAPLATVPLLDLSSGGARVEVDAAAAGALSPGALVRCRFALPDAGAFDMRAQLLRVRGPQGDGRAGSAALRWLDLGSEVEAELVRWVLGEQMRRARRGRG